MPIAPIVLAVAVYLLAVNAATFAAFAIDKRRARTGQWRITERTLLQLAMIGGTVGAMWAGQRLRHKTYKEPFRSNLRLIAAVQAVALVAGGAALVWAAVR